MTDHDHITPAEPQSLGLQFASACAMLSAAVSLLQESRPRSTDSKDMRCWMQARGTLLDKINEFLHVPGADK